MRGAYEIFLLEEAEGIEIRLADEAESFLRQHFGPKVWYAEYLRKELRLEPSYLEPFGGERFGYHGILESAGGSTPTVFARYSQDKPLIYLAASLFVFFKCLNAVSDSTEPLAVELGLRAGNGGSSLSATYSKSLHEWLMENYGVSGDRRLPFVRQTMLKAGRILRGDASYGWEAFVSAELGDRGGVWLTCDRDCCCMGAGYCSLGTSFTATTHNSNKVEQQLTFLAGVAAVATEYAKVGSQN
ncbi:MAG: hypothetical protein BWY68_00550 [bacterium ADurb.Bin400]|nr:MAG: hypothetical protein BWY68_00550 [bacterium ADurb.Bin400]